MGSKCSCNCRDSEAEVYLEKVSNKVNVNNDRISWPAKDSIGRLGKLILGLMMLINYSLKYACVNVTLFRNKRTFLTIEIKVVIDMFVINGIDVIQ